MQFNPRAFIDRLRWIRTYPVYPEAPARFALRALKFTWDEQIRAGASIEFDACEDRAFSSPRNNVSSFIAAVFGQRDLNIVRFWRRALPVGSTFFDIGANIGLYAIAASAHVGPAGRVICFEAHPETCRYLQANVDRNGASNVVLENMAVGAASGLTRIAYDRRNPGESHIATDEEYGEPTRTVTLDAYCSAHGIEAIDYMKIDVEGFETNVLRGAAGIIARNPQILIQTEYEPNHLARYDRPEALGELLLQWGFMPHRIEWRSGAAIRLSELENYMGEIVWSKRMLADN